jgi:hypothetical protein
MSLAVGGEWEVDGVVGVIVWWRTKRMKDPVRGRFRVEVCARPGAGGGDIASHSYSALVLGVVSGPGIPPRKVRHSCQVRVKKYPNSGQVLPVMVDRADPRRLVILWNEVPVRPPVFTDYA